MKLIFLNFLLHISSYSFSQIGLINTSLAKPDSSVLYYYMDNWLKITGITETVNLISKNGTSIGSYHKNEFLISPESLKKDTLIAFFKKKMVLKKIFSIDTLSNIIFRLGNIKTDTATIAEIIANRGLIVKLSNPLYNFPNRIRRFEITFVKPTADTIYRDIEAFGNMISKGQEIIIKILIPKSKIIFHDIELITPNSRVRAYRGFTIITK